LDQLRQQDEERQEEDRSADECKGDIGPARDRLTSLNYHKTSFFGPPSEKKDPHIPVFSAFSGTGWVKAWVKIIFDFRALGSPNLTSKSGEFRQTERVSGVFSTRIEKKRFSGVSGREQSRKN
jgi:hypothetical protein